MHERDVTFLSFSPFISDGQKNTVPPPRFSVGVCKAYRWVPKLSQYYYNDKMPRWKTEYVHWPRLQFQVPSAIQEHTVIQELRNEPRDVKYCESAAENLLWNCARDEDANHENSPWADHRLRFVKRVDESADYFICWICDENAADVSEEKIRFGIRFHRKSANEVFSIDLVDYKN
jgi:hypothetical protein